MVAAAAKAGRNAKKRARTKAAKGRKKAALAVDAGAVATGAVAKVAIAASSAVGCCQAPSGDDGFDDMPRLLPTSIPTVQVPKVPAEKRTHYCCVALSS
mgnify:CR=1 FL=1